MPMDLGTLRLLEAMRILRLKDAKFYQASTSEMFGKVVGNSTTGDDPLLSSFPLRGG